jgi:hypothetical protein
MVDHAKPSTVLDLQARRAIRTSYVKWSIFGVALPLLPLAAHALAALVSPFTAGEGGLSFTTLFSDGELLVIATVISAAVIGDLLFDISGRSDERTRTGAAILCAFALLVVVVSVLMYGLVAVNYRRIFLSGSTPVAVMSIVMFLVSLSIGAASIWFQQVWMRKEGEEIIS